MRKIWVVIYKTTTNEVYGWFCKAENPDEAEQQFRQAVTIPCTIKNVSECQSNTVEGYFFLYGQEETAGEHRDTGSQSQSQFQVKIVTVGHPSQTIESYTFPYEGKAE